MILLLGGTSETALVAGALALAGYRVLVSTATDAPLFIGSHPAISRRHGRLDAAGMTALVGERGIRAIVDATHPYASEVRATAAGVAESLGIPYLSYMRPPSVLTEGDGVSFVSDHEAAARLACEAGKPVLLTVGSRNVRLYAEAARRAGVALVARVLDHPESLQACRDAGIPEERLVTGRGPFSVEENRRLIRRFGIGVLVTKESGDAGGVKEKLEAARSEGCGVIVVGRAEATRKGGFESVKELVRELERKVTPNGLEVSSGRDGRPCRPSACGAPKALNPSAQASGLGEREKGCGLKGRDSLSAPNYDNLRLGGRSSRPFRPGADFYRTQAIGCRWPGLRNLSAVGAFEHGQTPADGVVSRVVLALDLESVLVPEIWQTVAAAAGVPDLASTTRECADYDTLMRRRIELCREHGLTLPRLREIVAAMAPFPGAAGFLDWARARALVVIVSDTFHELAGPIVAKLGCPLMLCNTLKLDAGGFIEDYEMRDPDGKAGAVASFQRLGLRVFAVGDSFNDLAMLDGADGAFLFRPARRVLEAGAVFAAVSSFEQLQAALELEFAQDGRNGRNGQEEPSIPSSSSIQSIPSIPL